MVFKVIVLAGLVVLLTGCGGGTDPDPTATVGPASGEQGLEPTNARDRLSGRLTLDEMRAWCTEYYERGDEMFPGVEETWGDVVGPFEYVVNAVGSVNPPEELEEFWEAYQRAMEVALSIARKKPAGEPYLDGSFNTESEFQDAGRAMVEIQQSLEGEAYNVALYCVG